MAGALTRAIKTQVPIDVAAALTGRAVIGWAMGLTVVGWSVTWAEALGLVDVVPIWGAAIAFFVGLALIPLGLSETSSVMAARHGAADRPPPRADGCNHSPATEHVRDA